MKPVKNAWIFGPILAPWTLNRIVKQAEMCDKKSGIFQRRRKNNIADDESREPVTAPEGKERR